MTDYSTLAYWENRYQLDNPDNFKCFEWYQTFDTLKEKIIEYLKTTDKILHVGCGTSKFAEELYIEEFKDVVNIDFSENAIQNMLTHYKKQQVEMNYQKMDVCNMSSFPEKSFNVVFDKALLDTILCGEDAFEKSDKMMKEIYRVLTDDGYYIIVSNGNEESRKIFFDEKMWEYKVTEIERPSKMVFVDEKEMKDYHYIYILSKKFLDNQKDKDKELLNEGNNNGLSDEIAGSKEEKKEEKNNKKK